MFGMRGLLFGAGDAGAGLGSWTSHDSSIILLRVLWLRLGVLGAIVAGLLTVWLALRLPLNYGAAALVIAVGLGFTALSWWQFQQQGFATNRRLLAEFCTDLVLITLLVALTGGAANPFIYYLLVLVAIAATVFSYGLSWAFSLLCVSAYTLLMYLDFRAHLAHTSQEFQIHLLGMWVNFVGSAFLVCFFVSRLARALRDRQAMLARVREQTLKNEQLVGIGTLAASTVHALGSPLATLAVLLGEMRDEKLPADTLSNVELMLNQVERCKETTQKLSLLANQPDREDMTEPVGVLLRELQEHYQLANPAVMPAMASESGADALRLHHSLLLRHALINLIDNAIHAADREVRVRVEQEGRSVAMFIEDDGDGIPPEVAENWGRPFFSMKSGGLGIGIFLANTTIEKLGGQVRLYCGAGTDSKGTTVKVELPLAEVDSD